MLGLAVLTGSLLQEDKRKEKDYEVQNDGSGGIGWGLCCGHGSGDGVEWGDGCGWGEDGGGGAGAASYPAEGLQPDSDGRGHCSAAERRAGNENGGDWAEYVAVGYRGAEVLAHLQTLRGRLA